MAQTKTINLDVNTNTKDVQEQFNSLRNGIKETTEAIEGLDKSSKTYEKDLRNLTTELTEMEQVQKDLRKSNTDLGASFEDIAGEVQPLTGRMGEMEDRLYELALAGKENTKEFQDLTTEVGKFRRVQQEVDLTTDAAAQTMNQKLGGALQGATSGFAAVQGAMGLFGTESEAIEKTLLKVQSAMALSEGIKGVREGAKSFKLLGASATKAFKGMKAGLAATGIGLFLVALGTVVAYWDDISKAIGLANTETDILNEQYQDGVELLKAQKEQSELQLQIMELEGATAEDLHKSRLKLIDDEIELARQKIAIAEFEKKNDIEKGKRNRLILGEILRLTLMPIDAMIFAYNKIAGAFGGSEVKNLSLTITDSFINIADITKEADANIKNAQDNLSKLEASRKLLNLKFEKSKVSGRSSSIASGKSTKVTEQEAEDKRLEQLAKEKRLRELAAEKERLANLKALRDEFETSLEAETDIANQRLISEQEFEVQAVQDKYFNLIEQAEQFGLDTQVLKENQEIAIAEIEKRYEQEAADRKKEIDDKAKQERDDEINAIAERYDKQFQLANDSLGAIGELVTVFAGEGEEAQKKAFKINKAISIGQAIISTAQGITAQLAVPQDALTGANFVKAGIVAMTGIAQVAKIKSTKFEGGGGGGGVDAPTDAGATATPTAQFNVVGDSNINQLAELQQQPTKAFVVSGDVTTAQSLDRNRVQNATL